MHGSKRLLIVNIALVLCSSLAIAQTSPVSNKDIKKALEVQFDHQVLTLKHPCPGKLARFNGAGECHSASPSSPWTLDSLIRIDDVWVNDSALELSGYRVVVTFDKDGRRRFRQGKPVRIEIQRDGNDYRKLMSRVFLTGTEKLSRYAPDSWKAFLAGWEKTPNKAPEFEVFETYLTQTLLPNEELVARVSDGMKPPKALSAPDPNYPEFAKAARFEGSTMLLAAVDRQGIPQGIQIIQPAGFGLDEEAVAALKKWRFEPATRNGEPVSFRVCVEVNFRIY